MLMPVIKPQPLLVLATLIALALFTGACGSVLQAPLPTRTPNRPGATPSGTPVSQVSGLAAQGYTLFTKYKCAECHSLNGTVNVAPPLNGLFGSRVQLTNGQTVNADEAYLKLSILEPDAQIVNGFPSGVMSGHVGQFEAQIAQNNNLQALVAFIESQK